MSTRRRSLMAGLLLLTIICQSALPCRCAKCGIGMELSAATCGSQACDGDQCQAHLHQSDSADFNSASQAACCHCPHEPQDSCPNSSESTCRRLVVMFSGSGSELQLAVSGVVGFGWQPVFFMDASVNLKHFLTCTEKVFRAFEFSRLIGCFRLQV